MYFSTASFCSAVVSSFTSLCSGAITMYVAPKRVSQRVVYTSRYSSLPSILKRTEAPSLRPIQFLCIAFTDSGQSRESRSSSRRSAYAVILRIHCLMFFFSTFVPQRSHLPSFTSSFASPVLQLGHQLIGVEAS